MAPAPARRSLRRTARPRACGRPRARAGQYRLTRGAVQAQGCRSRPCRTRQFAAAGLKINQGRHPAPGGPSCAAPGCRALYREWTVSGDLAPSIPATSRSGTRSEPGRDHGDFTERATGGRAGSG
ncbi:hypothetical protein GCM10009760_37710 [Kitasatospora kazusensis]|uniref:Uncharacterized protein n=1 Tax=Kitasatospora kazusensis TaxID=407974 RepID=A0ABP5LLR2_9ACTN